MRTPLSSRPIRVPLRAFVAVGALVSTLSGACSGTSSNEVTPVPSAIVVRGGDVTRGLGCGAGATEAYRYAVVAYPAGQADRPFAGGLYDCFADATLVRPPVAFGTGITVEVFVFDKAAYDGARAAIESAGSNREALRAARPTWSTTCTAVYLPDVETFASCSAVASGSADAGATSNGGDGGDAGP